MANLTTYRRNLAAFTRRLLTGEEGRARGLGGAHTNRIMYLCVAACSSEVLLSSWLRADEETETSRIWIEFPTHAAISVLREYIAR